MKATKIVESACKLFPKLMTLM